MGLVGLLHLHVPYYLRDSGGGPAGYLRWPGLLLLVMALASVVTAMSVLRSRRWGWWLGIGVALTTGLLYLVQETVGLAGLQQTWWEPTRLLSLLAAAGFVVLAFRHGLGRPGRR